MRLFVAGIRKLIRRPATWVTFGLLVGLLGLILISIGATADQFSSRPGGQLALLLVTFPAAYAAILSFVLGFGGLLALVYGAAIGGSEWSWGTLKAAVARGESRSRYQLLTFGSVAFLIGVALLLALGAGMLFALAGATLAGVPTSGISDPETLRGLPEILGRGWLALLEQGALGFAIATLARSQLAGIGAGIAAFFGEGFAGVFFPDVVRYLPFQVASAVASTGAEGGFGGGGGGPAVEPLPPDLALVAATIWLVGALLVAALFTERAEISG